MIRSNLSKKPLRRILLAAGAILLLVTLTPQWRSYRANSLAKQAEQVYSQDPVKAIAMLKVASRIKSSSDISAKLDQWQLVAEVNAKPQGTKAVALAERLAKLSLLDSAEKVLLDSGTLNSSGTILLAEIRLALGADLEDIKARLTSALANDPADIGLHESLRKVHNKLGDQKAASEEAAKIDRLKTGRP